MGGKIRVIHIVDGETSIQSRHTNPLPEYVKNMKFIKGDREYIKEYINTPSSFREKREYFSPNGYGLDIYDFDKKIIYNCQSYTHLKTIQRVSLLLYYKGNVIGPDGVITPDSPYFFPSEVKQMWDENILRVASVKDINGSGKDEDNYMHWNKEELKMSFEEVYEHMLDFDSFIRRYFGAKRGNVLDKIRMWTNCEPEIKISHLEIDWEAAGWTYKHFEDDLDGFKAMFEDVQKHYQLSERDKKKWEIFLKELSKN